MTPSAKDGAPSRLTVLLREVSEDLQADEIQLPDLAAALAEVRSSARPIYVKECMSNAQYWAEVLFSADRWKGFGLRELVKRYLLRELSLAILVLTPVEPPAPSIDSSTGQQ